MAVIPTVTRCLWRLPRHGGTVIVRCRRYLFLSRFVKMLFEHGLDWNPLPRRTRAQPGRNLVIRDARTESKGPSLGLRALNFEFHFTSAFVSACKKFTVRVKFAHVMFICNHCPFVIHLKKDIVNLSNFYMKKGLAVIAISSNSVTTHPQDGPDFMAKDAKILKYPFLYLYDESQEVARSFGAICTPEFFLFKRPFELVYHRQFDDSRPSNNVPITGRELSLAIECLKRSTSTICSEAQHKMAAYNIGLI